jgi:hypothetical protein
MNTLVRSGLSIGIAALFAGCGGSSPPIGAPFVPPENETRVTGRDAKTCGVQILHASAAITAIFRMVGGLAR